MMRDECIFCMIADGKADARRVYEDDTVVAFLDGSQTTPGHTLLIPRDHVENILDYDAQLASEVFSRLPKVAQAVSSFDENIQGLNVVMNNGEAAYQTVFHSHIHLIPRYDETDGFGLTFEGQDLSDDRLDQIAASIQEAIKE